MLADYLVKLPEANLAIHRLESSRPGTREHFKLRAIDDEINMFSSLGANTEWFNENKQVFNDENKPYYFSDEEAIEAGIIDEVVSSDDLGVLTEIYEEIREHQLCLIFSRKCGL